MKDVLERRLDFCEYLFLRFAGESVCSSWWKSLAPLHDAFRPAQEGRTGGEKCIWLEGWHLEHGFDQYAPVLSIREGVKGRMQWCPWWGLLARVSANAAEPRQGRVWFVGRRINCNLDVITNRMWWKRNDKIWSQKLGNAGADSLWSDWSSLMPSCFASWLFSNSNWRQDKRRWRWLEGGLPPTVLIGKSRHAIFFALNIGTCVRLIGTEKKKKNNGERHTYGYLMRYFSMMGQEDGSQRGEVELSSGSPQLRSKQWALVISSSRWSLP